MRAVAFALVLALVPASARADDKQGSLAEAMRLEAALDYQGALVIVERVIAQGGADRDQLVTLHLFAGRLAAGLDRTAVAEDHFARVLAIEPRTTFAEGTSPKITEPFDAARARSVPLRVNATVDRGVVTIVPEADSLQLVAGLAVTLTDGKVLHERAGRRVELPDGARATEVSALDTYGNRVWTTRAPPAVDDHVAPLTIDRPFYKRWSFWALASVSCLGLGGLSAWRFDSAQNEWNERKATMTDFSELEAIEVRGRRWGLIANISFGAAAATGILAIVAAAAGASSSRGMVTATPDAVGLAIASDF